MESRLSRVSIAIGTKRPISRSPSMMRGASLGDLRARGDVFASVDYDVLVFDKSHVKKGDKKLALELGLTAGGALNCGR
jgi:hypothetical protein